MCICWIVNSIILAGKRDSRRHRVTTGISENVVVTETSYLMPQALSFCDRDITYWTYSFSFHIFRYWEDQSLHWLLPLRSSTPWRRRNRWVFSSILLDRLGRILVKYSHNVYTIIIWFVKYPGLRNPLGLWAFSAQCAAFCEKILKGICHDCLVHFAKLLIKRPLAFVASVSVRFRSKERGTRVKDRA